MKKIVNVFLALAIVCFFVITCNAQMDLNVEFNGIENSYIVKGTTTDQKCGDTFYMEVYLNGNFIDACDTESVFAEDGTVIFEFEPMRFSALKESGNVTFNISSEHSAEKKTVNAQYCGVDLLFPIMTELKKAIELGNFDSYIGIIEENEDKLFISTKAYKDLSYSAKNVMSGFILKTQIDIPENCQSADDSKKVLNSVIKFKENFKYGYILGRASELKNSDELIKLYNEFSEQISMNENELFIKNISKQKFYEIFNLSKKAFSNIDSLRERFAECAVLTEIATENSSKTKETIENNSGCFNFKYSAKLSNNQKNEVYRKLSGNTYKSYEEATNAFDAFAYKILYLDNKNQNGGSAGGSSGGSSWGSVSGKSEITVPPSKNDSEIFYSFSDIKDVPWACDAINALYEKGIVSGRDSIRFCPFEYITRAELAKILVLYKNSTISGDAEAFFDVKKEDWYYGYVMTARKNGIINGDEKNYFNPNEHVTREDAAVMIYRTLHTDIADNKICNFTDNDEISGYAKEAVGALYNKGIINGMGNGMFEPKSNSTRAQICVLIFNALKN